MTSYTMSIETLATAIGPEKFALSVFAFLGCLAGVIIYSLLKTPEKKDLS